MRSEDAYGEMTSLEERARHARAASEDLARGRDAGASAPFTASNSSCDTRCDTPDEEAAPSERPDRGGWRAAILSALRPSPPLTSPDDADAVEAAPAGADAAGTSPASPGLDGGGPVPRLQDPVDMSAAEKATRTISIRLTEDDFQLVQERCREHGLSRSDYIRQLARADAVVGETGMRRVLVLDRTSVLAIAKEMRAWGRHYNQAVHALNVIAKYLRSDWRVDADEAADLLVSVKSKLDDVRRGQEGIEGRIDELCCLDAIRGR